MITEEYATINGRGCNDINVAIHNIKCPICGQKMDVIKVEQGNKGLDFTRKYDSIGHLILTETHSHSFPIKWVCMNCTAELSATAKTYTKSSIDLDADI